MLRPVARPVRRLLRRFGFDITPYTGATQHDVRMHWLRALDIDLVVDVGANEGQFVGWMRERGYAGRIVSFEPQATAFGACSRRWGNDAQWTGIRSALGEAAGEIDLQIAGNSVSSSILPMLDSHVAALPESAIVSTERIRIARLDEELGKLAIASSRTFLKIDAQGFELPVLRGASGWLDRVAFLELELSLVPLYEGQELLPTIWSAVGDLGFTPIWIEQGFSDAHAPRMLQVDGLFVKTDLLPRT
jgi:FkbM family methyltransferase